MSALPSGNHYRVNSIARDVAGRVNGVTGSFNPQTSTYASLIQYAPHGAIESMIVGSQAEQTCFNNRLQRVANRLGNAATANCGLGSTDLLWLECGVKPAANNGYIATQTITAPMTAGG